MKNGLSFICNKSGKRGFSAPEAQADIRYCLERQPAKTRFGLNEHLFFKTPKA